MIILAAARLWRSAGQSHYAAGKNRSTENRVMLNKAIPCAAQLALGLAFNRQAFNDFVLAQGLLPPRLLRQAVMDEFVPAQRP